MPNFFAGSHARDLLNLPGNGVTSISASDVSGMAMINPKTGRVTNITVDDLMRFAASDYQNWDSDKLSEELEKIAEKRDKAEAEQAQGSGHIPFGDGYGVHAAPDKPTTEMIFDGKKVAVFSQADAYKRQIDGTMYPHRNERNPHPRTISLARVEGDQELPCLQFSMYRELSNLLEKLPSLEVGGHLDSTHYPLSHAHVLWSFAVRLTRVEDDSHSLSVVSKGWQLRDTDRDESLRFLHNKQLSMNPPGLEAPTIQSLEAALLDENGVAHDYDLVRSNSGIYSLAMQFSKQQLIDTFGPGRKLQLRFTVARSYFSLGSIIDLNKETTVSADARAQVALILRGGKPETADWEITGKGEDDPVYYVHKAAFFRSTDKPSIAEAQQSGQYGYHVKMLNGGKRACLYDLDDHEVRTVIRIAYGLDVPVPKQLFHIHIFIKLHRIFGDRLDDIVVPAWEREICRRALDLGTLNLSSSSMREILHLLNVICEGWYLHGWFGIARRVAYGVLADMMHLSSFPSMAQFLREHINPHMYSAGVSENHVTIVETMTEHLLKMHSVSKKAVEFPDKKEVTVDKINEQLEKITVADEKITVDVEDEVDTVEEEFEEYAANSHFEAPSIA